MPSTLRLTLSLLLVAALGLLGWWIQHQASADGKRVQEIQQALHQAEIKAMSDQLQRERQMRAVGDEVQTRLAAELADQHSLLQEKEHALQTATTGRACLRADALRVLDGAPGIRVAAVSGHQPAASGAAAPAASAASHPDDAGIAGSGRATQDTLIGPNAATSDTQMAAWALHAGRQYEECRSRVNALIDFLEAAAAARP